MSEQLRLNIQGMHCGACVRRVTAALSRIPGVKVESVEIGSAKVEFDSAATPASQIVAAVNDIGFTAAPES